MGFGKGYDMSHSLNLPSSVAQLAEARKRDDDWTAIAAKQERKKRQNRLNQRAHRRRAAHDGDSAQPSGRRCYRVDRWRVNESVPSAVVHTTRTVIPPSKAPNVSPGPIFRETSTFFVPDHKIATLDDHFLMPVNHFSSSISYSVAPSLPESPMAKPFSQLTLEFPLSSDHLIHLIHHNVFRALTFNKSILGVNTALTKSDTPTPITLSTTSFCEGLTIVRPMIGRNLPSSLHPTPTQMNHPHSSWINMFPFPRLRDNMIKWHEFFSHGDFLNDLFGEIFTNSTYSGPLQSTADLPSTSTWPLTPTGSTVSDSGEDDLFARRNCLVVWGEPWDLDGWEATPGFVQKWPWLLEGCEDLIASTNRWRATRYEQPLRLTF